MSRCRVVEPYEETITHDGRTCVIRVPDLEIIRCTNPDCRPQQPSDMIILDDAAVRRLDAETYRQLGLLSPQEIRAQRERLGLTQQELQDLLRLGGNSLSRWESGAIYQSRSLDTLLRLAFTLPDALPTLRALPVARAQRDARGEVRSDAGGESVEHHVDDARCVG